MDTNNSMSFGWFTIPITLCLKGENVDVVASKNATGEEKRGSWLGYFNVSLV